MNRAERRARAVLSRELARERPATLTPVPRAEWPECRIRPTAVWISRDYLVQLFAEPAVFGTECKRLTVNRTAARGDGRWIDGMTWDELQRVKREVGFGDWYAVEIYPREIDVVNVGNLRHLWLLAEPLPIGWFNQREARRGLAVVDQLKP